MLRTVEMLRIVLITQALCLSLFAQEPAQEVERRTPPPPAGITTDEVSSPDEEIVPDNRPVTGVLPLTIGTARAQRSFVSPSFQFSQTLDSNPNLVSGPQAELTAVTNLSGNVMLQGVWRRSQLSLNYVTGGSIYAGHPELNSKFQGAQIQQSFQFRRWSLTLGDNFSYLPWTAFGYPGLANLGPYNLAPGTVPNQTIFTHPSDQISNTAVAQLTYVLNRRSSLTISGNFGLLHFSDGELLDSHQGGVQLGYNYTVSAHDSLGIGYGFNIYQPQASASIDSQNIQVAYGHRITGRLALQFSGGPQINHFQDPVLPNQMSWTAQSSLAYRVRRSQVQASYSHSVTAGGGVLSGASTDQVQGTLSTRVTRTLSTSVAAGYARNARLLAGSVSSPNSNFNTEFVNAGLSRPFGHQASVFLNYTFQHQSTNVLECSIGLCGNDFNRHIAGMGFSWQMRPILIH